MTRPGTDLAIVLMGKEHKPYEVVEKTEEVPFIYCHSYFGGLVLIPYKRLQLNVFFYFFKILSNMSSKMSNTCLNTILLHPRKVYEVRALKLPFI